jgi:hypothetical protein
VTSMPRIIAVDSVEAECRYMGQCACGGDWRLAYNEVALHRGSWVDFVAVRCATCDARAAFAFDVSQFFEPRPGVWGRTVPGWRQNEVHITQVAAGSSAVAQVGIAA